MQDIISILQNLRRPRLLIRAARIGTEDYRRDPHLSRVLGTTNTPRTGDALMRLIDMEAELDTQRESQNASYSVSRHVEVLSAMMGEARVLQSSHAR